MTYIKFIFLFSILLISYAHANAETAKETPYRPVAEQTAITSAPIERQEPIDTIPDTPPIKQNLKKRIELKIRSWLPWGKASQLTGWAAIFTAFCLTVAFSYKTFIPLYIIT
ncbi:MAG: hypothetical protein Q4P84_04445, partial [Elusimicrobiales bacterium]|nr:hypothetical protein [Elusimicrobiales bacterium]